MRPIMRRSYADHPPWRPGRAVTDKLGGHGQVERLAGLVEQRAGPAAASGLVMARRSAGGLGRAIRKISRSALVERPEDQRAALRRLRPGGRVRKIGGPLCREDRRAGSRRKLAAVAGLGQGAVPSA